jgi:hypothetical protein
LTPLLAFFPIVVSQVAGHRPPGIIALGALSFALKLNAHSGAESGWIVRAQLFSSKCPFSYYWRGIRFPPLKLRNVVLQERSGSLVQGLLPINALAQRLVLGRREPQCPAETARATIAPGKRLLAAD